MTIHHPHHQSGGYGGVSEAIDQGRGRSLQIVAKEQRKWGTSVLIQFSGFGF